MFVLQVVTGAKDGNYYAFAQALKSLVERHSKNVRLEVLKRVVGALDTDQIAPEGFQSFSFTWAAAMAQVRHREAMLART